jgi:hypothetical protein
MRDHVRRVAVVVLTIVLLNVAPTAFAVPRDRDDIPSKIVRLLERIRLIVRLVPLDTGIIPPHP